MPSIISLSFTFKPFTDFIGVVVIVFFLIFMDYFPLVFMDVIWYCLVYEADFLYACKLLFDYCFF